MANKNFNARVGLTVANTVIVTKGSNVGIGNTDPSHQLRVEGNTSVSDSILVNTSGVVNSSGVYHTGIINAASHTVGTSTVANSTGVYTGVVNATTVNATSVIASQVNSSSFYATTSANVGSNVQLSTTGIFIGNSISNVIINNQSVTVTPNVTITGTLSVNGSTTVNSSVLNYTGAVNAASHTVGTSTIANSTGVYTGVVNAASHTVGTSTIANSTGVYANNINATSVTIGTSTTVNSTVIYTSGSINVGSLGVTGSANVGGTLRVNGDLIINGTTTSVGTSTSNGDFIPTSNDYSLGNTSARWNLFGNNAVLSGNISVATINIGSSLVNSSVISINGTLVANSSLATVSALNVTNQTNTATFHATTSANVGANVQLTTSQLTVGNSTANSLVSSTIARLSNSSGNVAVTPNQVNIRTSDGSNVSVNSTAIYIGNTTASASNVAVNSSVITIGNSSVSVTINSSAFTGSSNNSTYLNGQLASYYTNATNISTGTLGSARLPLATAINPGAVQIIDSVTTTSITAAATANSVKTAYDTAISANTRAASAQSAAISAYTNAVAAIAVSSANNASFLGGVAAASYVQNTESRTLSGNLVFSGANVTFSGNVRFSGGIYANGSLGTAGHVLHSNGSSVYWDVDDNTGTVTSVASGNGLTGGPITSTGTLSVLANNGIISNSSGVFVFGNTGLVVNATGVHVNSNYAQLSGATFTGTVTANQFSVTSNAIFANSSFTKLGPSLTVGLNVTGTGNVGIGNTSPPLDFYVDGACAGSIGTLTDAATIAVDLGTYNNFTVTLGDNRTLGNPTNLVAGQSGVIYIVQDATGGRTLAYASNWKFTDGIAPTLSTAANAIDALVYSVRTTSFIVASVILNVG